MKLYAPITKLDDEQRMVFGYASTEALDSQGEIIRREAIEAALPDYMRFANIREMHQPSAIGVAKAADVDEKGLYLAAKVVDGDAWAKVKEGVYKGFSIGGRVVARDPANRRIVTGLDLTEISLVDRPANPEAVIDLYKAAEDEAAAEVAKYGARNSQADQRRIQSLHDTAVALGARCPAPHESMQQRAAGIDDLAKLAARLDAQEALLRRLADQPAPPRYALETRAVEKTRDGLDRTEDQAPQTPLEAIRKAHRNPVRFGPA